MPGTVILTDSTADLSPELIQHHHIKVVPLLVQFAGETYQDGINLDSQRLFRLVGEQKRLPTTSSPNPAAYQAAFAAATADGSQALYIGISTKFSSSVQNARIAADMFPEGQVQVFDSANLSTGIGLLVLHACDLAREGKRTDEIILALESARPKVRTAFVIDTLDYLYMGGRCSGMAALVGSLLKLRPIIAVVDGGMAVATKVRGSRQKGLDWMLDQFGKDTAEGRVRPDRVFITHTGVPDDARYMAEQVKRLLPTVESVIETQAGAVISSHCGPGTIGLLYLER